MCIEFCEREWLLGKHIVQRCVSYSAKSFQDCECCEAAGEEVSVDLRSMLAGIHATEVSLSKAMNLCMLLKLCLVANANLLPKKTIYCTYRDQKVSTTQKQQQYGWYLWGPSQEALSVGSRNVGLFPSSALMPNEGTWVHRGNPRRRELIPPGGIRRDVKYVSWYLCRATLNGFYI